MIRRTQRLLLEGLDALMNAAIAVATVASVAFLAGSITQRMFS